MMKNHKILHNLPASFTLQKQILKNNTTTLAIKPCLALVVYKRKREVFVTQPLIKSYHVSTISLATDRSFAKNLAVTPVTKSDGVCLKKLNPY